jgi:hypothetical protein
MATFRAPQPHRKQVWRISERAPMGEWVDLVKDAQFLAPPELPEVSSGSRVDSSFDLLNGTDIIEDTDADTIPADLLDELFAPTKKA